MYLAKVVGTVVSTTKHENLVGKKILITQEIDKDNRFESKNKISIDYVGAGVGDIVIIASGSSAGKCFSEGQAAIDSAIVGIVDTCEYAE